jgi:hypothetical protein
VREPSRREEGKRRKKREKEKERKKEKERGKRNGREGKRKRKRREQERKGEGDCVGADRGGWSHAGDWPPSGAGWDGGQIRVGCEDGGETERVRARVWTGFDDE